MAKKKYVKVSIERLANLIENSEMFKALDIGGVDNWEWYGASFEDYVSKDERYNSFYEYIDDITSEESILRDYPLAD